MTHTYSILRISKKSFDDILKKLKKAGRVERYTIKHEGVTCIYFHGEVALMPEESEPSGNEVVEDDYDPHLEIFKLVTGGRTFDDYNPDGTLKDGK